MYYPRKIQKDLKNQLKFREIVVLTGMRRVGKTTLMRWLFDQVQSHNKVFLDLENLIDQKVFDEIDFNNIWYNLKPYGISSKTKSYIFVDEIQLMPQAIKAIKYLYDHYDVKFFITGSSSFYLKNLFPESLAGRKVVFELFPLTFQEFLTFKEVPKPEIKNLERKVKEKNFVNYEKYKKFYDEYLQFGGFPQVVLQDDIQQKQYYLNDIFNSYFEKDVKTLADFRSINTLREFILILMQRTGSKLDISKLASELKISRPTVYSYLNFLSSTYFLHLVPPYSKSIDREVSSAKKVYFCDTGLLNWLTRLSDGTLFENAIFNQIKTYGGIKYYQKRSGAEIDFVIPEQSLAFEVKITATERDLKKLERLSSELNFKKYFIISKNYTELPHAILAINI